MPSKLTVSFGITFRLDNLFDWVIRKAVGKVEPSWKERAENFTADPPPRCESVPISTTTGRKTTEGINATKAKLANVLSNGFISRTFAIRKLEKSLIHNRLLN